MNDLNFLGTYGNIREVWTKYPNGGLAGDYVDIGGVRYRWDKYNKRWRREGDYVESTARQNRIFRADVTIENNLTVAGTLRAKRVKQPNCGLFRSYEALLAKYPNPEPGYWACVGETIPAAIYRCEQEGEWSATGEYGGNESVDLDRIDSIEEKAGIALKGATARFSEFVEGIAVIEGKAPEKGSKVCVVWDDVNSRFLLNVDGNYYTEWDGKEIYCNSDGSPRRDKLYICDNIVYLCNGTTLVDVTENLYAKVSNAGFGGTEAEMYVALVAAIRRTIETDISSPARMEVEDSLDGFIGQGETDTVTCRVLKGYLDVTPLVERWKITREGGDEASDAAWNASDKARNFSGTIDLTLGDLSIYRQSTIFRVTAEGSFSEGAVAAEIVV